MKPVEWRRKLGDSRTARLCAYAALASFTGLPLLFGVVFVVALPAIVAALVGNPPMAVLVALLALVGGPVSLLYLWPLLTDPDQRRPIVGNTWLHELSTAGIAIAALVGAVVHVLVFLLFPYAPILVVLGGGLTSTTGTWFLLTEGRIDPDERTLSISPSHVDRPSRGRTVDMDTWTGLSRYSVGPIVLLRPTYARGIRGRAPRLIPVPVRVARDAAPVFEAALATPAPEPDRAPNPVVAATLVLFGLGTVALGATAYVLEIGPLNYRLYTVALSGVFGLLFLAAARREY